MSVIYTIGYEGTDIERFIETLQKVGVKTIADVRAIASSRKKGFSKNSLQARLQHAGITYRHFVELGDPKDGRNAARTGKFLEFKNIYSQHLKTDGAELALDALYQVAKNASVCLLCFERDPATCHRRMIADQLVVKGLQVFDLIGDDPDRYVHHNEKLPRRYPRQGNTQSQPEVW